MNFHHVKCKKCKYIHFELSKAQAKEYVHNFNVYYSTLPSNKQMEYYDGKSITIEDFKTCKNCGENYNNFVKARAKEIKNNMTIHPILKKERVK